MKSRLFIADLRSNNNKGVCTGHFFAVAENYKQMFETDCDVKIAGGPIYKTHFKEDDLFLLPCDSICDDIKIKNIFRVLRNAWKLFRYVKKDDVIVLQQSVPAMILFSILLTYFGSSNVYMIQYNEEPMHRFYFKIMMLLAGNRIKGIVCPNDKVGIAYKRPYIVVPDYIYVNTEKEIVIPFSEKKFDFCIVGRLNKDKGVLDVINFFKDKPFSLLIAGNPDNDEIKQKILEISEDAVNIKVQLGYLSENDYKLFLSYSRFCILNYYGDYANRSSGVVYDTIFSGVPVVGRECSALQVVKKYDVGLLYKDISSFNPLNIMNGELYEEYQKKIKLYKLENNRNLERLKTFLNV